MGRTALIKLKRVYEAPDAADGKRFLVERLWPRGVKKSSLPIAGWLKDAAPTTELRKWFSHDPKRWNEFQSRYRAELEARPEAWMQLMEAARKGTITLIYSSHDTEHNNAVALRDFLTAKLSHRNTEHRKK
jgi:uncharacterized protein YeaO (DUF488 family)